MPLLRLCDCASLITWDDGTPEKIAESWFDKFADPHPSLYAANTLSEEAETVAAFRLTGKSSKRKACHVLRIDDEDLAHAGIPTPDYETPGNTGFVAADFRHCQITATRDRLISLVERMLQHIVVGEDRLRWIGTRLQETCWRQFMIAPLCQVTDEAKRRATCLINKHPFQLTASAEQLTTEYWANPPAIPPDRIEFNARVRWKERQRCSIDGTPEKDWLTAEKDLRDIYLKQLAGFTIPAC